MTTIEPLECPECKVKPMLFRGINGQKSIGCGEPGRMFFTIHITDTGAMTDDQLVAVWNERVRKIKERSETK